MMLLPHVSQHNQEVNTSSDIWGSSVLLVYLTMHGLLLRNDTKYGSFHEFTCLKTSNSGLFYRDSHVYTIGFIVFSVCLWPHKRTVFIYSMFLLSWRVCFCEISFVRTTERQNWIATWWMTCLTSVCNFASKHLPKLTVPYKCINVGMNSNHGCLHDCPLSVCIHQVQDLSETQTIFWIPAHRTKTAETILAAWYLVAEASLRFVPQKSGNDVL